MKGILTNPKYADNLWVDTTVARILRSTVYLGHMTQGKVRESLCEGKPKQAVKQEDWIIVKNTHEPIITQELFDAVGGVLDARSKKYFEGYGKHKHLARPASALKGLVYCAECAKALKQLNRVSKKRGGIAWTYECRTHKAHKLCSKKAIQKPDLYIAVYEAIRMQLRVCADVAGVIDKLNKESSHISSLARYEAETEEAEKELRRITSLRQATFEDYAAKLLSKSEHSFANEKYKADAQTQRKRLEAAKQLKGSFAKNTTACNKWLAAFNRFIAEKELTVEMAQALIERIEVYENQKINIIFKFREGYINKYAHESEAAV
jgi:ubiquinone/menaquinone biosynthesis C-methylase UbiE